jgi:hypothetical protein
MVTDVVITIDAVAETFEVQQFDKKTVIRHSEPADNVAHDQTVSHDTTKSGIHRSMARLDERFVNSGTSETELASAYVVLTYGSLEGKARAREMSKSLIDWLGASSHANIVSLAAGGYGS